MNQSSFHSSGPPALPTLLQYYCTTIGQYMTPPPTPLFVWHTLYNIGNAISRVKAYTCPTRGQRRAVLLALRSAGRPQQPYPGITLEGIFWSYPIFEAVGYGEIQRVTACIQLEAAGYSGSAANWLDIDRYNRDKRDTKDTVIHRRDTGKIQAGYLKNIRRGRESQPDSGTPHLPHAHRLQHKG